MRLIYRAIEKFLCWFHRNDRKADVWDMIVHHGLRRDPVRSVPILINGVRLYAIVGITLRSRPVAICRYRGAHGPELDVKRIQGFYHAGRLYPGRLLHLYIKTGLLPLCKSSDISFRNSLTNSETSRTSNPNEN